MPATNPTPSFDQQTEDWKTRAHAKQQWLERTLAEPPKTPQDADRQTAWIKLALRAVQRGQSEIRHETALLDAYAAHLGALEMSLMAAAEQRVRVENNGTKRKNDRHPGVAKRRT